MSTLGEVNRMVALYNWAAMCGEKFSQAKMSALGKLTETLGKDYGKGRRYGKRRLKEETPLRKRSREAFDAFIAAPDFSSA